MLHFFPHYAKDVSDHPFAIELRRLQTPHRMFSAPINRAYKTLFDLLFVVYPRMVWFAIQYSVRSLLLSRPRPTAAIVGSDIESLIFGTLRRALRLKTRIVLETFIITPRRSPLSNALHRQYYSLILSVIDLAICHSNSEVAYYAKVFPKARCRFVFVPYGTTVTNRELLMAEYATNGAGRRIVTAGRSGRDYQTLVEAIRGLPCELTIICDLASELPRIEPSDRVTVACDCFGSDYIRAIGTALFVVVPLSQNDISAGQMVMLQAAALGRAVIITRTMTTPDYATDGEDALFVDIGNVEQMRAAVSRLLEDAAFRYRLGANASERFGREHSTEAYVRNLIAAIDATASDSRFG